MFSRLNASVAIVVVLVAIAGVTLFLVKMSNAGESEVEFGNSPLLTTNRSGTSVCLDAAAGAALSVADEESVQQALALLQDDLVGRTFGPATLSRGCPPPAAQDASNRFSETGRTIVIGPTTTTPSSHFVHIYVVPKDTFRDWFGDVPYGEAGEEMFCGNPVRHNCAGVTVGLYLPSGMSADAIKEGLRDAFGFISPFERAGLPTPPVAN